MNDRRGEPRAGIYDELGVVLLNKYIDGTPHVAQLVDISENGMLVRKLHEQGPPRDFYSIELELPGSAKRVWLWARRVWSSRNWEALRLVGNGTREQMSIRELVESTLARTRPLGV